MDDTDLIEREAEESGEELSSESSEGEEEENKDGWFSNPTACTLPPFCW